MEKKRNRIDCFKCTHFYITWDKRFSKGCKALDFKTNRLPSRVVFDNSGLECQLFKAKPRTKQKK
jgi:hypothetical protein